MTMETQMCTASRSNQPTLEAILRAAELLKNRGLRGRSQR